ncbi:MAG: hypothetical protein U1F08_02620 [Steroidobacteraceae bacterium]
MTGRVAVAVLVLAGGCAHAPRYAPDGATLARVHIESAPTPAWIFVDGTYVGQSPLTHDIPYTDATRFVEVVAVPMYPAQTRQVVRMVPPSLPQDLTFFLDNPDPRAVTR